MESDPTTAGTARGKPAAGTAASQVALDLTPPEPLGTWAMGPEPPWFGEAG